MDTTLSSSVSTLNFPAFHSTPREFFHLKTPNLCPHLPSNLITKSSSIFKTLPTSKTLSFLKTLNSPLHSTFTSQNLSFKSSPSYTHQNPASGYAAALLDIAQCNNSLRRVQLDVQRLSRFLQHGKIQEILFSPFVGVREKGQTVIELAKIGKVHKLLMGLLKMLIERNKVGIVNEVLMEFERIYDELIGTKVILVSSKNKD